MDSEESRGRTLSRMTSHFQEELRRNKQCFGCWSPVNPMSISPYCMNCVCEISHGRMDPEFVKRPPKIEVLSETPALEPVPAEEPPKKPQPRATDIFASTYPRTIDTLFKTLVPKEKTMTFAILQALYAENPERFRVISGIHQNSFDDKLHLSLAVDCGKSSYTLHVYGYWKNFFRVGALTIKDADETIQTIATF